MSQRLTAEVVFQAWAKVVAEKHRIDLQISVVDTQSRVEKTQSKPYNSETNQNKALERVCKN